MTTTPKSGAGMSRYLRLYRVLSQALAEGQFEAGGPLPSEPRLMRDYGISRSTVRRALARLEAEGRIERKRGSGTFARHQRKDPPATGGSPAAATCRSIALQHIPTPAFLLHERSGFGAATVLIRQIRYVGHEPMGLESVYVPEELAKELTRQRLDAKHGAVLAVLAALGHRSATVEREFAALATDPLSADSLRLAVGAPLFNVRTLARDQRSRTLAYLNCVYRPDRYEAHTDIQIADPKRQRAKSRN